MQNSNNSDPSTKQNISNINKLSTNKSREKEDCKQEKENRCCGETKAVLNYGKCTDKHDE
ncbi:hypothetical protein LEMLEM_LOCUS13077, partial [Lemmus lemmus]